MISGKEEAMTRGLGTGYSMHGDAETLKRA